MRLVQFAFHLIRLASEALFLFELNKTLGALVQGGRRAARKAYVAAEKELLAHSKAPRKHVAVALPDGTALHTLIAGVNGPAVVLLHGHSMCGALFFAQLDALCAAGYSVFAPDLPGWGRSSRPLFSGGSSDAVAYYTRRVLAWIDALSLNRFALVGHSLGSYVAHEVCTARPNAVVTLTLAAPAAVLRPVDYATAAWFCLTPQRFVTHGGLLAACLFNLRYPKHPCYSRRGVRQIIFAASRLGAGAGDAAAAAMLRLRHINFEAECDHPLVERATKLHCPITLIAGELDALVSLASMRKLAEVLRAKGNDVRLEVVQGADHCPQLSAAEQFSDLLKNTVQLKQPAAAASI